MRRRLPFLTAAAAAILCVSAAHGAVTAAGANSRHLPKSLHTGKQRLKKDHYVLSMTATAGTESASHSVELIVK
jgi:hypothetical protein